MENDTGIHGIGTGISAFSILNAVKGWESFWIIYSSISEHSGLVHYLCIHVRNSNFGQRLVL